MAIFYFFAPLGYFTKSKRGSTCAKRGVNVCKKGGQRVQAKKCALLPQGFQRLKFPNVLNVLNGQQTHFLKKWVVVRCGHKVSAQNRK